MDLLSMYQQELRKLDKKSELLCVKVYDGMGQETKHMNINNASIDALVSFLLSLKKEVKK